MEGIEKFMRGDTVVYKKDSCRNCKTLYILRWTSNNGVVVSVDPKNSYSTVTDIIGETLWLGECKYGEIVGARKVLLEKA